MNWSRLEYMMHEEYPVSVSDGRIIKHLTQRNVDMGQLHDFFKGKYTVCEIRDVIKSNGEYKYQPTEMDKGTLHRDLSLMKDLAKNMPVDKIHWLFDGKYPVAKVEAVVKSALPPPKMSRAERDAMKKAEVARIRKETNCPIPLDVAYSLSWAYGKTQAYMAGLAHKKSHRCIPEEKLFIIYRSYEIAGPNLNIRALAKAADLYYTSVKRVLEKV